MRPLLMIITSRSRVGGGSGRRNLACRGSMLDPSNIAERVSCLLPAGRGATELTRADAQRIWRAVLQDAEVVKAVSPAGSLL
jgi:hypothetical protein